MGRAHRYVETRSPTDRFDLSDQVAALFPTPTAQAGKHASTPDVTARSFGSNLWDMPSLLPTPRAQEPASTTVGYGKSVLEAVTGQAQNGESTPPRVLDGRSHGERGRDGIILNPKGQQDLLPTLPTPLSTDYNTPASEWDTNNNRLQLRDINALLPTPTVMDMGNNKTPQEWETWKTEQRAAHNNGNGHGESLTQAAMSWGKYALAIRRWEKLTRPAVAPTIPYKEKQRLNPVFVEWMMGLPEGHVTGHDLSTAKQLKILGNGVVPQQAEVAISQLLERTRRDYK